MENKFVLITGSARGLGKELALIFAQNGYGIILHDRTEDNLKEIKGEISKKDVPYFIVAGDLKSEKTLDDLYKISKDKGVSILINNAGVHCPKLPLEKLDDQIIDDILLTNLVVPVKLTRRIYSMFVESGHGTIININSMSGLENQKFRTVYSASKWGLRGFSDTLKLESEENKVRIIDIYPTRIKTRPEFTVGMETRDVARKVYEVYKNTNLDKIILDEYLKNNGESR